MKIKKFNEYQLNESIFDIFKKDDTYSNQVKSSLHHIIESVDGISEKYFKGQDKIIEFTKNFITDDNIKSIILEFENKNERSEYCAEYLYSLYKENMKIIYE